MLVFLNFSVNLRIDFVIDDSTINLATFLVNLLKGAFTNFWINFIWWGPGWGLGVGCPIYITISELAGYCSLYGLKIR